MGAHNSHPEPVVQLGQPGEQAEQAVAVPARL